ncbi:unnamed protein product, partial [Laminaria digitata]
RGEEGRAIPVAVAAGIGGGSGVGVGGGGGRSGAGNRKRTPRTGGGAAKVVTGRSGGGGGGGGGSGSGSGFVAGGGGRANGALHASVPPRTAVPPAVPPPSYHPQLPVAVPVAAAPAHHQHARVGGAPLAQSMNSGLQGWEGQDLPQQEPTMERHPFGSGQGTWAMEGGDQRLSLSPPGPKGLTGGAIMGTPPLAPTVSSLLGRLPPDSPEYLEDLAIALGAVTPPPKPPSVGRQPLAMAPSLGPALLSSTNTGMATFGGGGGGG